MTQQDYEWKKRECWEQFWHEVHGSINRCPETYEDLEAAFYTAFDRAYALGKQKETITQEDVEKASVEYADKTAKQYEVCNSEFVQEIMVAFEQGANFALGKQEKDADAVIQGWVARCEEGYIDLFQGRPSRSAYYKYGRRYGSWTDDYDHHIELPREILPDLTWESDPEEVEIIIKRKKNE